MSLLVLSLLALLSAMVMAMPAPAGRQASFNGQDDLQAVLEPFCIGPIPFGYTTSRKMKDLDRPLLLSDKYQKFFRASNMLSRDAKIAVCSWPNIIHRILNSLMSLRPQAI
jgi:hypothetical protein